MINGRVDVIRRDSISGWCADSDDPNRVLDLLVQIDGVVRGRFAANRQRPDLRALNIYGEGNHGFYIELMPPLSFEDEHEIVVRPVGAWGSLERGRVRLLKGVAGEQVIITPERAPEESHDTWGSPKYVIHIGPHKTGSTYLQMAFDESKDALLADGVFYPDVNFGWLVPGRSSHMEFHRRLVELDAHELPGHFKALNSSKYKIVLISSEDLVGVSHQGLRYLRSLLSGRPVEVVYYCRRWSDLLASAWQETVKQGELHGFGEFIAAQLADPMRSSIVNFDIVLSRYVEVFGIQSIRLVAYNHLMDSGIDLYEHFINSVLELNAAPKVMRVTPNQSLNPAEVELVRLLNGIAAIRSQTSGIDIFRRYWRSRSDPDAKSLISGMSGHLASVQVDDSAPGLRALHEFLFQKYRWRMVEPSSGFNLFPPNIREVKFVRDIHLLLPEIVERVVQFYDKISR